MRSGTSFFDRTVFKKTFLRFWPLWATYSAAWLITLPLNGLTLLRTATWNKDPIHDFAWSTVPRSVSMVLPFALVFGVLAAMAAFSHLYDHRSANFFGALPMRREALFLTHYLAGLSFLIVPNLAVALLTLLVELAGGVVCLEGLLVWLAASCGECFLFYTMAVFCGAFTGHILALPVFYGILNVLVLGLMNLSYAMCDRFYYGFSGFGSLMEEIVLWTTPVMNLGTSVRVSGSRIGLSYYGLETLAIYAAVAVALSVGAFFLYRNRRLESAGDVVSVRAMRPVFKFGVAICTGLLFGVITAVFIHVQELGLMASILVWGTIGYFAAQMLLDRSFRVFHKWKGAVAVAGAFVALFMVVGFDFTGFETRVPAAEQVAWMEVSGLDMIYLNDDADHILVDVDDPEIVQLFIDLHHAAVDQRSGYVPAADADDMNSVRLTYHLEDGSTLSRRYSVWVSPSEVDQEGTASWAVERLYAHRGLYWKAYDLDRAEELLAEGGRVESVTYDPDRYGTNSATSHYYAKDAQALYEAMKEDLLAGDIGARSLSMDRNMGVKRNLELTIVDDEHDRSIYIYIAVQDGSQRTLETLERLADSAVWS